MKKTARESGPDSRRFALGRFAALFAVVGAVVLVALFFFRSDSTYTVKARFLNAAQLVKGNVVDIGGTNAGLVKDFELTPDGQAEVTLQVDEKYAPLRRGTRAVIRSAGQTSVSGRYVQLMLPAEPQAGDDIEKGGVIDVDRTTTNVDLDQFFNIFDKRTRAALQGVYKGGSRQYAGRGKDANRGLLYLNPQLAASSRLFRELRHEPAALERLLVDSSRFVGALSERRGDLSALIGNLNRTTRALGNEKQALAEAIGRFPDFMRQANTTYVNLRSTLDELDPFVEASKPVARRLRPYLAELRPFANEAVPTVRNVRRLVRTPGGDNDVTEMNRTYPGLEDVAVVKKRRSMDFGTGPKDVGVREGAFPQLTKALRDSAPIIAHGRPYTPDFLGWFDDFSHTGAFDALGSFSRGQAFVNAFSVSNGIPLTNGSGPLGDIPLAERPDAFRSITRLNQVKRCPGASEEPAADGSNVFSEEEQKDLDCRESDRATGALP